MTHTTPFSGEIIHPWVGFAVVDPLVKFKECSFIHSRNIDGGLKFWKELPDQHYATFDCLIHV